MNPLCAMFVAVALAAPQQTDQAPPPLDLAPLIPPSKSPWLKKNQKPPKKTKAPPPAKTKEMQAKKKKAAPPAQAGEPLPEAPIVASPPTAPPALPMSEQVKPAEPPKPQKWLSIYNEALWTKLT